MALDADTYGTIADVEALVGDIPLNTTTARTFSITTTPTLAQAEGYLDEVAAELNSALEFVGYTIPVKVADDKSAFNLLARANNAGASVLVLDSIPAEAYQGDEPPSQGRRGNLDSILKRILKLIYDEKLPATKSGTGTRLDAVKIGSELDSDGDTKKPIFTRAMSDFPSSRSLTET